MPLFTDQLNRSIELKETPRRIVSLVPSQTEYLSAIGLEKQVVGITRFCIHPENWFRSKQRVGGTKDFKPELIRSLKPDLIIANKEENDATLLQDLMKDIPVWVSDVNDLDSACAMMESLGNICGKKSEADKLVASTRQSFEALPANLPLDCRHKTAVYLIWNDPYMAAGTDTFIHNMLSLCELQVIPAQLTRYPEVSVDDLISLHPDLLFLSSEPYPFKEEHREKLASLLPGTKVLLCDGEYFSWYGPRLKDAPTYFSSILTEAFSA